MRPKDTLTAYEMLLDTARTFTRAASFEELIDSILTQARRVMGAEACSILLPDDATGELVIHSAQGDAATLLNALRIPRGAGIAGQVFATGKAVNIPDVQSSPHHYKGVDRKTGFITRSMLTVPLLNAGKCVGVLQALNPEGRASFDDRDERVFELAATLAVSALLRLESEKTRMHRAREQQELQLAREIQSSFLPPPMQAFPTGTLWTHYVPANEVGGDFYLAHPVDENRTLFALGDITGKGIPAALTMARTTARIQAMAFLVDHDLGGWVTRLGTELCRDFSAGRFVGITFLLTDAARETVQVCCAGQFAPIYHRGHGWTELPARPQMPIGIIPGLTYTAETFPLQRGDYWLLYSDGVSEARNAAGEELGKEGLLKMLPAGRTAAQLVREVPAAWRAFVGGAAQHDDASYLLLDWRGLPPPAEFEFHCLTEDLHRIRTFIEEWAQHLGYDDVTAGQIVLAVDEATTNVHRYAYFGQPGAIHYRAEAKDGNFVLTLRDFGKPCDPALIKGRELHELRPGGLGSFLLNMVFSTMVHYDPRPDGTLLTLKKPLPEEAAGPETPREASS
jgi:sigma-B regulation protein RsbU (phosphoserine phosphatase)